MAINKKLIHFKSEEAFRRELDAGNILETSICWVPDAKFIYTRGSYWYCLSKSDTEIQAALTAIETALDTKVDKVDGKGLSTNDLTDELLALIQKVSKPLNYKGSVATYDDLPTNALEGDVYNVVKTDVNYAWTGTEWDPFGSSATNIVNDLTTGGIGSALSAEQGKVLKGLVDTNTTAIATEKTRAEGVEETLTNNLATETAQRKAQDNLLQEGITAEEARAMQAEADNTLLIKAETTRATKAEDEIRASAGGNVVADGGDIPVMPLYRQANTFYTKPSQKEDLETCPLAVYVLSYNKPYVGKPINRIKMMLGTPGRCRISIFNKNIFKANPTEEASLVKDLVNVVCTSSGYKYWDLDEDVVVEEGQYVGAWFTQDCARYTYNSNLTYQTAYPSGWTTRKTTYNTEIADEDIGTALSTGYLNVGLYQRGGGSDFEWGKIDENAGSVSSTVNSYGPMGQEKLVGKTIYKLRMNVDTIGYFTVNIVNNFGKAGGSLYKSWKLYIRQQGVQTIRLPEDIVLKEGQGIVFNGEGTTCKFKFGGTAFGTKYALDGFYSYADHDFTATPSQNTTNRLNIGFIERGGTLSALEDKTISIQGDSITTFAGTITDGNAAYYSPAHKYVNSIDATWWGLLVNECRMRLVRNDAWSGSRVSGTGTNAMSSSARCSNLRGTNSSNETYTYAGPEIIIIMCGTNDLGGNVSLGSLTDTTADTYMGAFKLMLQRIKSVNQMAKVVVFQLYRGNGYNYANSGGTHQYEFQEAMEKLCKIYGAHYIDPEKLGISYPNTSYYTCDNTMETYGPPLYTGCDYLHPNMQGMERIYAGVRSYLEGLY